MRKATRTQKKMMKGLTLLLLAIPVLVWAIILWDEE